MKIGCKFALTAAVATLTPGMYAVAGDAAPDTGTATAETSSSEGGLQEIIVTAEKRSSSLERTPISITAFSGEQLAKAGIRTLTDMQWAVPSFQMGENDGYAQITIRGIGVSDFVPTAEGAVAVNQNEVYVSRPIAQLGSFFDVGSLEVLRGPQGTLYGRNATAGSVNITSARPTNEWSGYVRAAAGNYSATTLEGAIGGPIINDKLLIRVAGIMDKHAGYGKNLVTGTDISDKNAWGARATVVFTPTADITETFIAEHYNEDDRGAALHYFGPSGLTGLVGATGAPATFTLLGGYAASNLQDIAAPRDPKFFLRYTALTNLFEWRFDPFTVKSVTGYREQDSLTFTPLGGGSTADAFFIAGEPAHQLSEELQLHYDSSRVHATAGLFWFKERDASTPGASPFSGRLLDGAFGLPPRDPDYIVDFVEIGGTIRTVAKAAFTQATIEVLDGLSLTAGVRYSDERKEADLLNGFSLTEPYISTTPYQNNTVLPPVTHEPEVKFVSTTPKAGVQYQIDPNNMVYFTFSKGFKSGGYDVTTVSPAFQPERLTAYEVGSKSDLLNKHLRVNVSAFWYDYSNLQVLQVVGPSVVTSNAGVARIYGVESEVDAIVTDAFKVHGAATWLHARYRDYVGPDGARPLLATVDFSGNALNNAPNFKLDIAPEYTWQIQPGSITLKGEADYSSRFYFTPANIDLMSQGSYVKVNGYLTFYSKSNWDVSAFVRNATDRTTRTSGVVNTPILGTAQGAIAPPRTFGMSASYHW